MISPSLSQTQNSPGIIEDLEMGPSIDDLVDGDIGEEKYDGINIPSPYQGKGVGPSMIIQLPRESA